MKKWIALYLTLACIVGLLVVSAVAADAPAAVAAEPQVVPLYPSLSLEGAVQYNLYFRLQDCGNVSLSDMGLLVFDSAEGGSIDTALEVVPGAQKVGSNYYVHTNGIPAKNLGDAMYFRVYAKLADGSYVYTKTLSYSARVYAKNTLKSASTTQAEKDLAAQLMHYGASAQIYFEYKTDSLMDVCIPPKDHVYEDVWTVETPATLEAEGLEYRICTACGESREERAISKLTVASVAMTKAPDKTDYYTNQHFLPAGMELTATLSDGSAMAVTEYTFDTAPLTAEDTSVTVSYGDFTVSVPVDVSEICWTSVSDLTAYTDGTLLAVEGYFVGVAEEGPSADQEMLLKDLDSDDLIAVRGVPYGEFPSYGYAKGDRVLILATVDTDTTVNTPNKRHLDFGTDNGTIDSTILSRGNAVSFDLTNTVKVSSWEEMQALFAVGTVESYSYIEFTGELFFNRYGGSDGVDTSRMHMNAAATGVSTIRTDGKRTVGLRDNVMQSNLGENWAELFFDAMPESGNYPGYRAKGKLIGIYTGGNNYYFQLTVLDDAWVDLAPFDNYDVVVEIADTFFDQGPQIQYDQTGSRRNLNPTPEMATGENTIYLDCSSYVNAVYRGAFGVNVMNSDETPSTLKFTNYAIDNPDYPDVIGYWENANFTTATDIADILATVRGQLQVGDLLVYRHGETSGTNGHVYIYIGNDQFLHCTGSSYVYGDTPDVSYDKGTTDEKTIGAVQLIHADDIFVNTTNKRYLFKVTASDSVYSFALLRPMNRGLTPTESACNRMKMAGLRVERSVDVGLYNSVFQGGTLTYTVTLNNTSSYDLTGVVITEYLPDGVSLLSGDGWTVDGNVLTYVADVDAGETLTLSYSVTVEASGTIVSEGQVGGVAMNTLTNTVSSMTAAELSAIAKQAKNSTVTDPTALLKALYADFSGVTSVKNALSQVIDSSNKTLRTDTALSALVVPNLYGGVDIKSGFITDNQRTRLVKQEYLAVGDVILAEHGSTQVVFVYLGDGQLLRCDGTRSVVTVTGDEYASENVLVTLIAYDRFAVIRPSMK